MKRTLLILACGAGLLAAANLLHASPARHATRPATPTAAPVVLGAPASDSRAAAAPVAPVRKPEPEPAAHPGPASPASRATARRFISAFLSWQQGHRDPHTTAVLRATASPALWRQLAGGATVPAPSAAVPAERLRQLIAGTPVTPAARTVLAELERRHRVGTLALVLHHAETGWRVTAITR